MEEEKGRHNGLRLNAHSMVSKLQTLGATAPIMNIRKWLNKPRDALRLLGSFI
jgi:hypothetical protein